MSAAFNVAFQILICRREKMVLQNTIDVLQKKELTYSPVEFEVLAGEFGDLLVRYQAC